MVETLTSGPFKRGNETGLTYDLERAAWEWLYHEAGCRFIGLEVKLEGPGGRIVDLAVVVQRVGLAITVILRHHSIHAAVPVARPPVRRGVHS